MKRKSQQRQKAWRDLIEAAEVKLERSKLKTGQLQAIIETMRSQAKAGEPCPTELAALGSEFS